MYLSIYFARRPAPVPVPVPVSNEKVIMMISYYFPRFLAIPFLK